MRIRTIKPEFFLHEGLFELERESSLPVRLAFAGLWCAADREGRFKWEARRLGIQILPYDNIDFSRVLHALTTRGFVVRYRVGGECFGWIPSFEKHQVINNRERESDLPPCDAESILVADSDACHTRATRVPHAGKAEGKGREGNMEGKGKEHGAAGAADIGLEADGGKKQKPESKSKAKSAEEAEEYAISIGCMAGQGDAFFWKMEGCGWMNGGKPVKDWKATIIAWERQGYMPVPVNYKPVGTKAEEPKAEEWDPHAYHRRDRSGEPMYATIMALMNKQPLPGSEDEYEYVEQEVD